MLLLVGLGNPGNEYALTRHNVGFWVIDKIAQTRFIAGFSRKFNSEYAHLLVAGHKLILLKPQTYMNLSGRAVSAVTQFYKIPLENTIVIHDDLDLPLGKVKLKRGGSAAGHKGLQSIDDLVGSNYWRMRIGIGHPGHKDLVSEYVLSKPPLDEKIIIDQINDIIAQNISYLCDRKFEIINEQISKL